MSLYLKSYSKEEAVSAGEGLRLMLLSPLHKKICFALKYFINLIHITQTQED